MWIAMTRGAAGGHWGLHGILLLTFLLSLSFCTPAWPQATQPVDKAFQEVQLCVAGTAPSTAATAAMIAPRPEPQLPRAARSAIAAWAPSRAAAVSVNDAPEAALRSGSDGKLPQQKAFAVGVPPAKYGWFNETVEIVSQKHECSGVLVSDDAILTAGHCVCDLGLDDKNNRSTVVRFGVTSERDNIRRALGRGDVDQADVYAIDPELTRLRNPDFCKLAKLGQTADLAGTDLAILRIKGAVQPDKSDASILTKPAEDAAALFSMLTGERAVIEARPGKRSAVIAPAVIALPRLYLSQSYGNMLVVGYGDDGTGKGVGVKRHACIAIASRICGYDYAQQAYGCALGREMVLADQTGAKDSCNGDSGGPVFAVSNAGGILTYYLVGITSRGVGGACGRGGIYSLLTPDNVAWIRSQPGIFLRSYPFPDQ